MRSEHEKHLFPLATSSGVAAMHDMRLRYYLYIAVGAAALVLMLTDPEIRPLSHIAALFQSLAALAREVSSALR
jgi:hypothetical protein